MIIFETIVESDTIKIPELSKLIGKKIKIQVEEEGSIKKEELKKILLNGPYVSPEKLNNYEKTIEGMHEWKMKEF